MRHALKVIFFLQVLILPSSAQDNASKDFAHFWKQATNAYQAKDYAAYFENMQAAVKFRPDNPNMKYNLAGAHALVGKSQEALALLAKLADMGLIFDAAADEDFNSIKDSEAFKILPGLHLLLPAPKFSLTKSFLFVTITDTAKEK
jgi:hypothetical protein